MLPLSEAWYRRQLLAAMYLGVFGGIFALAFSIVTTWAIDRLFGDAIADPWSGEWWWIALTAGGAVLVAAMRKALTVPDEVPGAIAMAKVAQVDHQLAPRLGIISVVSLVTGASLGPSFAIVVAGGGMGTLVVQRRLHSEPEAESQYTLPGMSGVRDVGPLPLDSDLAIVGSLTIEPPASIATGSPRQAEEEPTRWVRSPRNRAGPAPRR